jgi:hypothetical protein
MAFQHRKIHKSLPNPTIERLSSIVRTVMGRRREIFSIDSGRAGFKQRDTISTINDRSLVYVVRSTSGCTFRVRILPETSNVRTPPPMSIGRKRAVRSEWPGKFPPDAVYMPKRSPTCQLDDFCFDVTSCSPVFQRDFGNGKLVKLMLG